MLHSSPNRATPVSVENITKLVRQNYKPVTEQEYSHEKVQCRTDTTCQKSKPEDYWTTNFHRRKANMQKGFYSSSTEPYRPIGGQLVLDPCELALSTFPGTVNRKVNPRMTRRGTIYEEAKDEAGPRAKEKNGDDSSSFTSLDLVDTAPSAGYDDIKKLLKESRHRLISVRAGKSYEDHVRGVEEAHNAKKEAAKPVDTGMVIKSVSSVYMNTQTTKPSQQDSQLGSRAGSRRGSRKNSGNMVLSSGDKVTIAEVIKAPSPVRKQNAGKTKLKPPAFKNKITLMQVGTEITSMMLRKERQLRDHFLYLKSMYNVLTALHNLKVKDIRSKVPLSREVVERLQKVIAKEEDTRGSRGTYASRGKGTQLSMLHVEGEQGDYPGGGRLSVFNAAKRLNTVDTATRNVFGRRSKRARKKSVIDKSSEDWYSSNALYAFSTAARKVALAEQMSKAFQNLRQVHRRKSKNAANISSERPTLETWEDLLNVQPEPYKEAEQQGGMCFQIGVVAKFMRWYRRCENVVAESETGKRRASIVPTHIGSQGPGLDKGQLSHLQEIHEKGLQGGQSDKGERETYGQQQPGSAAQTVTDRVKRLPIWQQVAQEKSTVFQNLTQNAPNAETSIQRFKKNLNKLKRSIQKENTATLEKMVRERVANFRLKFSALDTEECSPLFDEQKLKLQDVKDNVNKSHLENFDVQPSKWYEELKEKTTNMISSHKQPHILEMLSKVQTYAHMDNKTVSYAKAKLCLLMMSLPAYDICQIYMQKALKFIFENILLGQEAQFYEWLNHRKIPNMVVGDSLPRSNTSSPCKEASSSVKEN